MAATPAPKNKHPYISSAGGITKAVNQLRKQFPSPVTADTLKKLGIAPNNESYVLNILRFINVLDPTGAKTPIAGPIFNQADDDEFQKGFADLVEKGYTDLFNHHGEESWQLAPKKLVSFFRNSDQTSELVGNRQTSTFLALAGLAGKREDAPKTKNVSPEANKPAKKVKTTTKQAASPIGQKPQVPAVQIPADHPPNTPSVGLTVRIEVNLPAGGDQGTYDAIFKSIREHIINGNGS